MKSTILGGINDISGADRDTKKEKQLLSQLNISLTNTPYCGPSILKTKKKKKGKSPTTLFNIKKGKKVKPRQWPGRNKSQEEN